MLTGHFFSRKCYYLRLSFIGYMKHSTTRETNGLCNATHFLEKSGGLSLDSLNTLSVIRAESGLLDMVTG